MKKILLPLACFLFLQTQAQNLNQIYNPSPGNIVARSAFQDRKFGMFIHWGASSVLGDGEWVMENHGIQTSDYKKLIQLFNPIQFDAAKWVSTAKNAGMKYMKVSTPIRSALHFVSNYVIATLVTFSILHLLVQAGTTPHTEEISIL